MSRQVIIIPDLHGRLDLLEGTLKLFPDAHFLSLGDAIDRGPQSLETVKRLLELHAEGRATLLMGNHERMAQEGPKQFARYQQTGQIEDFRQAMQGFSWWMKAGGESVRREVPVLTLEEFPETLLTYLNLLRRVVYVTADGQIHDQLPDQPSVLVAHASPPVAHRDYPTPESAALWLRPFEGPFALPESVTYSVHGHTPTAHPARLGKHIYTDLGAYETGRLALLEVGDPTQPPQLTVLQGPGRAQAAARYVRFGEPLRAREVFLSV